MLIVPIHIKHKRQKLKGVVSSVKGLTFTPILHVCGLLRKALHLREIYAETKQVEIWNILAVSQKCHCANMPCWCLNVILNIY